MQHRQDDTSDQMQILPSEAPRRPPVFTKPKRRWKKKAFFAAAALAVCGVVGAVGYYAGKQLGFWGQDDINFQRVDPGLRPQFVAFQATDRDDKRIGSVAVGCSNGLIRIERPIETGEYVVVTTLSKFDHKSYSRRVPDAGRSIPDSEISMGHEVSEDQFLVHRSLTKPSRFNWGICDASSNDELADRAKALLRDEITNPRLVPNPSKIPGLR